MTPPILSHFQAKPLLRARQEGRETVETSLDLGLTRKKVRLEKERLVLSDDAWLPWETVEEIAKSETACFAVGAGEAVRIRQFSEMLGRFYSLAPTEGAPTLLISGIPMHRIRGIDPYGDTLRKIRAVAPLRGRVLDICTGLGYTAIEAARTAQEVVTVELDPAVLEIARQNPWSRPLFETSHISQIVGDASEVVQTLPDGSFSRIVHDPPRFSLAGELYAGEFYRHLYRLLARGGRLFHYVGDPDSRSGRNVTRGVVRRLQEAGFRRVVRRPEAFGLVAIK